MLKAATNAICLHRGLEAATESRITGERVTISLFGDGYLEAIDAADIYRNAKTQHLADSTIRGSVVSAPVLESRSATRFFKLAGLDGKDNAAACCQRMLTQWVDGGPLACPLTVVPGSRANRTLLPVAPTGVAMPPRSAGFGKWQDWIAPAAGFHRIGGRIIVHRE
jgi:hypothetical protein